MWVQHSAEQHKLLHHHKCKHKHRHTQHVFVTPDSNDSPINKSIIDTPTKTFSATTTPDNNGGQNNPTTEERPAVDKKSKLEVLKKKAEASREKATLDAMKRMDPFDSTKASKWKTIGIHTDVIVANISGNWLVNQ